MFVKDDFKIKVELIKYMLILIFSYSIGSIFDKINFKDLKKLYSKNIKAQNFFVIFMVFMGALPASFKLKNAVGIKNLMKAVRINNILLLIYFQFLFFHIKQ